MHKPDKKLLRWILVAALAIRAITPAGFMPNAIASGSPFALCAGDVKSAQLLAVLAHGQHHHHQHTDSHKVFDNQCDFAVLGFTANLYSSTDSTLIALLQSAAVGGHVESHRATRPWLLPAVRAPPPSIG